MNTLKSSVLGSIICTLTPPLTHSMNIKCDMNHTNRRQCKTECSSVQQSVPCLPHIITPISCHKEHNQKVALSHINCTITISFCSLPLCSCFFRGHYYRLLQTDKKYSTAVQSRKGRVNCLKRNNSTIFKIVFSDIMFGLRISACWLSGGGQCGAVVTAGNEPSRSLKFHLVLLVEQSFYLSHSRIY